MKNNLFKIYKYGNNRTYRVSNSSIKIRIEDRRVDAGEYDFWHYKLSSPYEIL